MALRAKHSIPCFIQFCWDLVKIWWFVSLQLFLNYLKLKTILSVTSVFAVCISVCLTSLTPFTLNSWKKKGFLHLAKILWQSLTKSSFSFFTIFQIEIINFMALRAKHSIPCFIQFCWDLVKIWWFVSLQLFLNYLKLKTILSVTCVFAVYISVCLTSLTPFTLNSWKKNISST